MPDEVMMPVPTIDAQRQAEVAVMRQLSDNMAIQGRAMERLVDRVEEVRDKVIQLEAQKLETRIAELRAEVAKLVTDLKADHEQDVRDLRADLAKSVGELKTEHAMRLGALEGRAGGFDVAMAGLKGKVIPLYSGITLIAAAVLSFIAMWGANALGGAGPHHP